MASLNADDSETFIGFAHAVNERGAQATVEVAFTHDYAAEIDAKNGWSAKDAPDVERHNQLLSLSAKGLSELLQFCFHGQKILPNGRGLGEASAKFIAVASMIEPACFVKDAIRAYDGKHRTMFGGTPLTTTEVAMLAEVTVPQLNKLRAEFMARWGLKISVKKRRRKLTPRQ